MAHGLIQLYGLDNSRLRRWLIVEVLFAVVFFLVWWLKDMFFHEALGAYDFTVTCVLITTPFVLMIFTALLLHVSMKNNSLLAESNVPGRYYLQSLEGQESASCKSISGSPLHGSTCLICLEKEDLVALPSCRHGFHESCITKWFSETKIPVCPSCRHTYEHYKENVIRHT